MAYSKQVASHSASDTILAAHLNTEFDYIYATILNEGIGTTELTDANVTKAKLGADSVDGTKIADDAIDSEHYTDGSIDTAHLANDAVTSAKIADLTLDTIFGVWNDRDKDGSADTVANDTAYQAATDGIVCALSTSGTGAICGFTDGNASPTTQRQRDYGSNSSRNLTMPVRKSDYWKVTGATTVYWLPIGQ